MRKILLPVAWLLLCLQAVVPEPQLQERWSTSLVFKVPESVLYDSEAQRVYVSNIDGGPSQKNGKGFLSLLDAKGEILELEWVTGLNAPKGMGVHRGVLYVTDIDEIVAIDTESGKISGRHPIRGAGFLNDIAVDPEGTVYISDSSRNRIFAFEDGKARTALSGGRHLNSPNGLFWEDGTLLIGVQNKILKWNPETEDLAVFIETSGGIDGLQPTGAGDYLISDWRGIIRLVSSQSSTILMDVTSQGINTADFCYIADENLLIVPTFGHNQLWSFELIRGND